MASHREPCVVSWCVSSQRTLMQDKSCRELSNLPNEISFPVTIVDSFGISAQFDLFHHAFWKPNKSNESLLCISSPNSVESFSLKRKKTIALKSVTSWKIAGKTALHPVHSMWSVPHHDALVKEYSLFLDTARFPPPLPQLWSFGFYGCVSTGALCLMPPRLNPHCPGLGPWLGNYDLAAFPYSLLVPLGDRGWSGMCECLKARLALQLW